MKRGMMMAVTGIAVLAATAVLAGVKRPDAAAPAFHNPPGAPSGLPFSDAVQVGDLLFLAGKLGNVTGKSELVPGGITGQTTQTMEHIKRAVEAYGSSMDRVVKCTVFLADIGQWPAMNKVYTTYFPNNKPARSAVAVSGLALDALVEIECIAAL